MKQITTFGVQAFANKFIEVDTGDDLVQLFEGGAFANSKILVVGSGSNLLFCNDFDGVVVKPTMKGIKIVEKNNGYALVESNAGENWDDFVAFCVANGLYGLENLSYIPGNVGACPVQNIGAYGVEVKDYIYKVEAFNMQTGLFESFSQNQCEFGYRDSVFKHEYKGIYIVTKVLFKLLTEKSFCLDYKDIKERVADTNTVTLQQVRNIVIDVRKNKLPDPAEIGNAGSFFKNPVVSADVARALKNDYPGMVTYELGNGQVKLAAGWLIDHAGWKGFRRGDVGVHPRQALVLVNYGGATGSQVWSLAEEVVASVKKTYNVDIEPEVLVV